MPNETTSTSSSRISFREKRLDWPKLLKDAGAKGIIDLSQTHHDGNGVEHPCVFCYQMLMM